MSEEKKITITDSIGGYAHTRLFGTFEGPVTKEDIEAKVYHPMFGGRELRIDWLSKTFTGVRHED